MVERRDREEEVEAGAAVQEGNVSSVCGRRSRERDVPLARFVTLLLGPARAVGASVPRRGAG